MLRYNDIVVIPLITSLISNPNTPFNKRDLLGLFCYVAFFLHAFIIYVIIDSMKHLTATYNEEIYTGNIFEFYFEDMKKAVLDIETTGLNPSRNKFILGGLVDFSNKTVHQYFAENRSQEQQALVGFLEQLQGIDMVITYNGRHFDLPFMEKRMALFGMTQQLPYNLDLYLVLNGHSPIKKLVPNLKQKTVENYMGLWQDRGDEISGGESVELYNQYERTGDEQLEKKILLHNSDDVMQLTRLLKIISKCDFHKAMFHLGFPAGPLTVEKIRLEKNLLTISGIQRRCCHDYMGFFFGDYPVETRFHKADRSFSMKFPLIRDSGLAIVDLQHAGLNCKPFEKYPTYGNGFLALEAHGSQNHMEINHFIKAFIEMFMDEL